MSLTQRQLDNLKVDANGVCWEWGGYVSTHGYGMVNVGGTPTTAHRAMWETLVGPISYGNDLDHLCKNKLCVNPDHLEPVDRRTNSKRARGSTTNRCKNGHIGMYSEKADGATYCLGCNREAWHRGKQK